MIQLHSVLPRMAGTTLAKPQQQPHSGSNVDVLPRAFETPMIRPFLGKLSALRFGKTTFDRDYGVSIKGYSSIESRGIANLQRELLFRDFIKGPDDRTSMKMFLGTAMGDDYFLYNDQAAFADSIQFVDRPVDMAITQAAGPEVMRTLMSATGKRFMYPSAWLTIGKLKRRDPRGSLTDIAILDKLNKDWVDDLISLISERTGEDDTDKIREDVLKRSDMYNPLQALYYGKKGLVDAVMLPGEKVITRDTLEAYYAANGLVEGEDIRDFNFDARNLDKVAEKHTMPLAEFSPLSIPEKPVSSYQPLADIHRDAKNDDDAKSSTEPALYYFRAGNRSPSKLDPVPAMVESSSMANTRHAQITNVSGGQGTLHRDTVFFNAPFGETSVENTIDALKELYEKKEAEGQLGTNVAMVLNSPGGNHQHELLDKMEDLAVDGMKVDTIAQGMAASAAALTLAGGTGNRLATPNSRIMVHQASMSGWAFEVDETESEATRRATELCTYDYASKLSEYTGRKLSLIQEDLGLDVWMNPLEAMFYGRKGIIDGILVGQKVITRKDVKGYLAKVLDGEEKVAPYVKKKIDEKRASKVATPKRHKKNDRSDPFSRPLHTIRQIAAEKEATMTEDKRFRPSLPSKTAGDSQTISYYHISSSRQPSFIIADDDDDE